MFATRIVAVGSSKFLENDTAEQVGANFFTNSIDWLVKKNAVLDIAPKKPQEYGVSLIPMSYRTVVWTAACLHPGRGPGLRHRHLVFPPQITVRFVMFRNSSTYVYLAIALGLFCYVTFIDKKIPGTKEREEAETQLFKFNPDDVTGLEITNLHGFFFFEKEDGHWEITQAGQHPRRRRHRRWRHQPDRLRPAAARDRGRWQLRQGRIQPEGMGPASHRGRARRHSHQGQAVRTARRAQDGDQRQMSMPALPAARTSRCGSSPARSRTCLKRTCPISAAAMSSISIPTT